MRFMKTIYVDLDETNPEIDMQHELKRVDRLLNQAASQAREELNVVYVDQDEGWEPADD